MKHIESVQEFDDVTNNGKVLVDFFANWCGPCRMLSPIIEEVEEENLFNGEIVKVDVDQLSEIAARYRIQMIPTLYLFENGKLINKLTGYVSKEDLLKFLNSSN